MQKKVLYLLGFVTIAAVIAYLFATSFQDSLQYYVTAKEFLSEPQKYAGKVVKVAGIAHDIQWESSDEGVSLYHFFVEEEGTRLEVAYQGFVPDTFKEGSQVVVTGKLKENKFVATEILAKCASKYEAKVK